MNKSGLDILWVIVASALVFIMRAGFAMLETGLTRSKNSINVAVKVLTDMGIAVAAYWPIGFGLMFGSSVAGLFGTSNFLPDFTGVWITVFFLFHVMFASTAATIVSGAVAERIKYSAYIVGHWVWGGSLEGTATGWLAKLGFIDFAGSTVVHSTGGWISLAALLVLRPRIGRYAADGSVNRITGSNLQTSVIGAILLWFGWIGFNGGSTLSLNDQVPGIIVRTTLAGAAGLVVTLFVGWRIRRYPDVSLVVNGAIAGLVAITASCAYVNAWQSVVIGAVGGVVMLFLEWLLDRLRIDDAVTAIPVHLGAGVWGTLAVGLFGAPQLLDTGLNRGDQILVQLLGIGAAGVFSFGVAYAAIALLNRIYPIRVKPDEEAIGLNVTEHKASTELYDLYRTLEEQSRTGDLSLRAPVEPFTEVGQIADRYNALLDSLERNLIARSEYVSILDNVSDGLFLLDTEGRVGPHYSKALEQILGEGGLAGKDFLDILKTRMPEAKVEPAREFIRLLFDAKASARSLAQLNPLSEAELNIDLRDGAFETRYLQFYFKRVMKEERVTALMVILRDITEQKRLTLQFKEARESQRSEMELLSRIIQIEPGLLSEFMESFEAAIESINETLESNTKDYRACLDEIFRSVHMLKGDADMLGLDFIVEIANRLEDGVAEIRSRAEITAEDFLPVSILVRELTVVDDRMSAVLARVSTLQSSLDAKGEDRDGFISAGLSRLAGRLQERHAKPLLLDTSGFDEKQLPTQLRRPVRDILVQLIRNSVVHGIEPAGVRKASGKPEQGRLSISLARKAEGLALVYADDGKGIDLEAVRARAVATRRVSADAARLLSNREVLPLIFLPGFSTAEESDLSIGTAGRGIGLDAIRDTIRKLGGKINIRNRPGASCEFAFLLPLSE